MRSKKIVMELVAGGATVAIVQHGRIVDTARLPFESESDPAEWARGLRRFGDALRRFVEDRSLGGCPAVVLYQNPTVAVNIVAVPAASGAGATDAAALSSLDALPYSSLAAVVRTEMVGRDRSGDGRQIHVVVAADRDDMAAALVDVVQSAGLSFQVSVPIDALICRRMALMALRHGGDARGFLYIGEHSSYFVVGGQGRLLFERRLSFDIHAMTQTLRRPILRSGSSDATAIELNAADARRIATHFGVPDRNTVVQESIGLTGAQVIPLLQPLLQRLVVELRQSLRFGVSDSQRANVPITICGPGVGVPNLAETIGDELDVSIDRDEAWTSYDFDNASCDAGELNRALGNGRLLSTFNLEPNELYARRRVKRLKTWLWTGAAAAMAIVAIDYAQFEARLNDARAQADMLSMREGDIEALRATSERLESTIASLSELDHRVDAETASSMSFRAVFNELSRVTPEAVRLTSFNFNVVEGRLVGRLNGYVFNVDGDGGQSSLRSFIDALRHSPLLSDARLGDVQLGSVDGMQGRRFDAEVVAVPSPWRLVDQQLATVPQAGNGLEGAAD